MAIKFHYHTAVRDVPRLGIRRGDRCCHVYSDASVDELVRWGAAVGIPPRAVQSNHALPHFDLFGASLRLCGPGVDRRELVGDIRRWRARPGRSRRDRAE